MTVWTVGSVAFYFLVSAGIYLNVRLVSPRIPERGEIDLRAFHVDEGRKYLLAYTILSLVTVAGFGTSPGFSQRCQDEHVRAREHQTVLLRAWRKSSTCSS